MLFRRNTPATKLISAYFRFVGHDFLRASLGRRVDGTAGMQRLLTVDSTAPSIQDACNSDPLRKVG